MVCFHPVFPSSFPFPLTPLAPQTLVLGCISYTYPNMAYVSVPLLLLFPWPGTPFHHLLGKSLLLLVTLALK